MAESDSETWEMEIKPASGFLYTVNVLNKHLFTATGEMVAVYVGLQELKYLDYLTDKISAAYKNTIIHGTLHPENLCG